MCRYLFNIYVRDHTGFIKMNLCTGECYLKNGGGRSIDPIFRHGIGLRKITNLPRSELLVGGVFDWIFNWVLVGGVFNWIFNWGLSRIIDGLSECNMDNVDYLAYDLTSKLAYRVNSSVSRMIW